MEGLLAPFALHAVDGAENELVERHLAGCPRCAHEVGGFREAAALLACVGGPAPAGVWEAIAACCEPPAPEAVWDGIVANFHQSVPPPPPAVRRRPVLLAAAVVVALLGGVALARPDGQRDRQTDLSQLALATLADPGSDDLWLTSPDGRLTARVVRDTGGRGLVLSAHLPPLPGRRAYQLWALPLAGDPVPVSLLGRRPATVSFAHEGRVAGFAISEENEKGATVLRSEPVVSGRLQRPG